MIASKALVTLLALNPAMQTVADRAYSTIQLNDHPKSLRAIDNRYSFDHGGSAASSSYSSSSSLAATGRDNVQYSERSERVGSLSSFFAKSLLLAAVYFYIKFLSPKAVQYLSLLCAKVSEFKNSLESTSDEIMISRRHRHHQQQKQQHRTHRRNSCSSGATTKYRNINDERKNENRDKKIVDPINNYNHCDGRSISSSVMEILGLAEFEDEDDDDDDDDDNDNDDTNVVDEESFVSNNSTISTVSSFFSLVRSRRSTAASSCAAVAPTRTSTRKHVIRDGDAPKTNSSKRRNSGMAPDVASISPPKVLRFNGAGGVKDTKNNNGDRHCRSKRKEEELHTEEWLDDISHIPAVTIDC